MFKKLPTFKYSGVKCSPFCRLITFFSSSSPNACSVNNTPLTGGLRSM